MRAEHAARCPSQPCALDLSPATVGNFSGYSSDAEAGADLAAALAARDLSRVRAALAAAGAADAFATRCEAVSFKKVLLRHLDDALSMRELPAAETRG